MSTIQLGLSAKAKHLWRMFRSSEKANPRTIEKKEVFAERNTMEMNSKKNKIDFAMFQRKAYCGNFFAGPLSLFNPDLFE